MSVHWRAQCHAKWLQRSSRIQHHAPACWNRTSISRLLTTSLNHSTIGSYQMSEKKWYMNRHITWTVLKFFFGCTISDSSGCILRLGKQYQNSWAQSYDWYMIHLIAFDTDWSWNFFTLHNFCSLLIEQLIDLEKVRTDNLKFRTNLLDQVMVGWSATQ